MLTDQADEPVLAVQAVSTDHGISVTWTGFVEREQLGTAVRRLQSFLDWSIDRPGIMQRPPFDSVRGMPDAVGSLRIEINEARGEWDDFVEPSAELRGNRARVVIETHEWRMPMVRRFEFGPQAPNSPATTWSKLVEAIRRDSDRHV